VNTFRFIDNSLTDQLADSGHGNFPTLESARRWWNQMTETGQVVVAFCLFKIFFELVSLFKNRLFRVSLHA